MFYSKRRTGFTLVELLVVIIIISMLVGLTIPAVMMARERARRLVCANNLKNLGKAIQEYEMTKKQYPGWINRIGRTGAPDNPNENLAASWPVTILKNIGRSDIYDRWQEGKLKVEASMVQVSMFICPSSQITGDFPLSYVANCGQQDNPDRVNTVAQTIPPDNMANGVFFRHYRFPAASFVPVRLAATDIADGQRYTLLLSENLQAGNWANIETAGTKLGERSNCENGERLNGMIWWLGGDSPMPAKDPEDVAKVSEFLKINADRDEERNEVMSGTSYHYCRPSSYHPGGVNAVFCDGHTQFLDEQMDFRVFAKLMATDDSEVQYAGFVGDASGSVKLEDLRNLVEGKLSEDDLK